MSRKLGSRWVRSTDPGLCLVVETAEEHSLQLDRVPETELGFRSSEIGVKESRGFFDYVLLEAKGHDYYPVPSDPTY